MRNLRITTGAVHELRFSDDGNELVVAWGSHNHIQCVHVVNIASAKPVRSILVPYGEAALSADLTTLARMEIDRRHAAPINYLKIQRLETGEDDRLLPLRMYPTALAFSPDGDLLLVAGVTYADGLPTYEVERWKWRESVAFAHFAAPGQVVSLAMSRQQRLLVTGGNDNAARIWDNQREVLLAEWKHKAVVRRLRFTSDDRKLIAAAGCSVAIWDLIAARQILRLPPHRKQVNDIALSPDDRLLASASGDGTVRIWDLEAAAIRHAYNWQIGRVGAVAFSPDGLTVAAGGEGGLVVIWDVDG